MRCVVAGISVDDCRYRAVPAVQRGAARPFTQFLLAVLGYREPFATARLGAFVLIWAAIAVFAVHTARQGRAEPVIDAG